MKTIQTEDLYISPQEDKSIEPLIMNGPVQPGNRLQTWFHRD
ncbi:hypothetical protein L248_1715 [Schleiferilactobacillus shenzhenensis LY-73]|uniref:Uncharacterized protein n=1 Tax=Schleiferilactobacillus shenzhenensis LY-73 TaxID=1231336 RepID=U4TR35_9LACO|nr:hypothetical protein L248_1715 [Schleiferilactobacillus shenzhenensis LY-73]